MKTYSVLGWQLYRHDRRHGINMAEPIRLRNVGLRRFAGHWLLWLAQTAGEWRHRRAARIVEIDRPRVGVKLESWRR